MRLDFPRLNVVSWRAVSDPAPLLAVPRLPLSPDCLKALAEQGLAVGLGLLASNRSAGPMSPTQETGQEGAPA